MGLEQWKIRLKLLIRRNKKGMRCSNWANMPEPPSITRRNYYSPGSASLYFGGRSLGVRPMEVVFDSGSSFTYFAAQPYQTFVTVLRGDLSKTLKEKYGNACLGILNGSDVGLKDLNIVGDVTMQDQMVIYDNERGQIGWIRAPCDRIPNEKPFMDLRKAIVGLNSPASLVLKMKIAHPITGQTKCE